MSKQTGQSYSTAQNSRRPAIVYRKFDVRQFSYVDPNPPAPIPPLRRAFMLVGDPTADPDPALKDAFNLDGDRNAEPDQSLKDAFGLDGKDSEKENPGLKDAFKLKDESTTQEHPGLKDAFQLKDESRCGDDPEICKPLEGDCTDRHPGETHVPPAAPRVPGSTCESDPGACGPVQDGCDGHPGGYTEPGADKEKIIGGEWENPKRRTHPDFQWLPVSKQQLPHGLIVNRCESGKVSTASTGKSPLNFSMRKRIPKERWSDDDNGWVKIIEYDDDSEGYQWFDGSWVHVEPDGSFTTSGDSATKPDKKVRVTSFNDKKGHKVVKVQMPNGGYIKIRFIDGKQHLTSVSFWGAEIGDEDED